LRHPKCTRSSIGAAPRAFNNAFAGAIAYANAFTDEVLYPYPALLKLLSNPVGEHASPTLRAFSIMRVYEVRPRKDKRGFDLISDALPFGRLWYAGTDAINNAIGYSKFRSRSHDAVIRVFDDAGNVIETHEHVADSK
jgi:hypothetical protein